MEGLGKALVVALFVGLLGVAFNQVGWATPAAQFARIVFEEIGKWFIMGGLSDNESQAKPCIDGPAAGFDILTTSSLRDYTRDCGVSSPYFQAARSVLEARLFNQSLECIHSSCMFEGCIEPYAGDFTSGGRLAILKTEAKERGASEACKPADAYCDRRDGLDRATAGGSSDLRSYIQRCGPTGRYVVQAGKALESQLDKERAAAEVARIREAEEDRLRDEKARQQRDDDLRRAQADAIELERRRQLIELVRRDPCQAVAVCPAGEVFSLRDGACIPTYHYGGIIPGSEDDARFDPSTGRWVPNCP